MVFTAPVRPALDGAQRLQRGAVAIHLLAGFWASALTATAVPGLGSSLPELFGLLAQRVHLRLREFLLDLSHFLQVLGAREPLGKVE